VRQKLCKRLEDLERISAAAAAPRVDSSADYERSIAAMMEEVHAWHSNPVNQKWLAEQPPDYLYRSVQSLRAQLQERACGHSRAVHEEGFR